MMTGGKRTESCVQAVAERPSMKTVANGVRVTEAWVDAIKLITHTGINADGTSVLKPCAMAEAAKKRGKMMPDTGRKK
jgi:hypothetical protein